MRICVVTHYFHPESFRINDLVSALSTRGHDVEVLTGQPSYPLGRVPNEYRSLRPKRSRALGAEVVRVPSIARGGASSLRLAANYLSVAASARIFGVRAMRRPDVILAFQPSPLTIAWPALALKRRHKARAYMWIQDLWPDTLQDMRVVHDGWQLRLAGRLSARAHNGMDGLWVQSQAYTSLLEQQGVPRSKITYVPNWAERFYVPVEPARASEARNTVPAGFVMMFAGNLGAAQGLETIVGAAEKLQDISDLHWVILGDGRAAGWMRDEVARRKLERVHFPGSRPTESMPEWFALADAMILTLRRNPIYSRTIPSKLQAYLACGKAIAASIDGEGARQVEASGAGLVCAAGDAEGLAQITRRLYQMPRQKRVDMGSRGRAYYERNFDRAMLIDRIERLLSGAAVAEEAVPAGV